jgi:predicted DNA-binding transcriptional regulator AlpA
VSATGPQEEGLVGFRQLFELYGAGRSARAFRLWLWRAQRSGRFPAGLEVGPNSRAWRRAEVRRWAAELRPVPYAAERGAQP